ncbi:glycosyltransferase family 2 protein [Candidatus Saccharibacteria bacterium]|nr:glycosyltransferase family 2 protein [Candidatus Saccharibacteria bacterium]
MTERIKVVFLLPAFNESAVLGDVIIELQKAVKKKKYESLIVVIDDGSTDETGNIASASGVQIIRHILNTGSGGATSTGIRFAKQQGATIAATLDADGQHKISDVLNGVDIMLKNDIDLLIGSRLINSEGMSKIKILGNKGLSFITGLLFGVNVTDYQSGLRLYSQKSITTLRWRSVGYEFCSEMLWRAKQQGLIVNEYPIEAIYSDYSIAKGQNNWNAVNIVKSLIKHRIVELFGE